jgi:hypothetical protein
MDSGVCDYVYEWVTVSLHLGLLYSAGNYRNGHLPRKGLVDFTSSQISPITLWSEIDQKPTTKAIYTVQ